MEQHEVSDTTPEEGEGEDRPLWVPPLPPGPEPWSVQMVLERFGFLLAVLGVLLVFGMIYLNADWLLREPESRRTAENAPTQAATPTVSAAASERAVLTVISTPTGARVLIDGAEVGETPLVAHALEKGTRVVSVQKADFSTRDTVITVEGERSVLHFELQDADPEDAEAVDEGEDLDLTAIEAEQDAGESSATTPQPVVSETTSESAPDPSLVTGTEDDQGDVGDEFEEVAPEPEPPAMGSLQVTSQPSGATVLVAGKEVGVTPVLVAEVEAGSQPVVIRLAGFEAFSTTAQVEPGERTQVNGRLQEAMGEVRILAKPWGNIYIDGELSKSESTVWYTARLKPGSHRIRVEHPALGKWEQTVRISATENDDIVVDFNGGGQQ